jgi:ABC-type multidrug transport system ATPase subunit
VTVRGLGKRYGGRAVLDGLDLEVRRGGCFALLGPNGAGKTTTIEILEGVRRRDAGDVRALGEDPALAGRGWRRGYCCPLLVTDARRQELRFICGQDPELGIHAA